MPPKKKCTRKTRKAELVFLERPWEGPIHCCETPLYVAENPVHVSTKPVDQNTSAAWVCPQSETTKSLVLRACQKKRRGSHKLQNRDVSYGLLRAETACRRSVACKFPPLIFENSEVCSVRSTDMLSHAGKNTQHSHIQCKKGIGSKANIQVIGSENCSETPSLPISQPVGPEVFSPLDMGMPQLPSLRNCAYSSALPQISSHAELLSSVNHCGREQLAETLVMDTPEHEYGIKVTWRHRPHLLKYLRDRGKLSTADILVKAHLEL
ncbi:RAD9, HUS1, RAD1-interacting nuclear orphan protein 1 [Centrocercus urophasianus]|uniref:RAD9, HUS1, RAD1-interacting nuclear orphan protein 1 n=1 Tax=Centrocercus urophasianus TaxID=9002 RepID=UPI001C64C6A6|nr:RAD9, HUS1, RAD1-interacting nuclear orphan protein 1 [Centrocercus urophasianus]XP_042666489.1 RAD9, HUS1, RAD1-interacting nuclear orphan protein 1 [Centrocercus urophasianus]